MSASIKPGTHIGLHFMVLMYTLEGPDRSIEDFRREFLLCEKGGQAHIWMRVALQAGMVVKVRGYNSQNRKVTLYRPVRKLEVQHEYVKSESSGKVDGVAGVVN